LAYLKTKHPKWLEAIRTEKALSPKLETELKEALASFTKTFA
ncbi:MAG: hypothetical protein JWM33_1189, partial [Caulobacteraceae bacterium]|nr:hypothetical protein [Caulobacteraceae bacterium]